MVRRFFLCFYPDKRFTETHGDKRTDSRRVNFASHVAKNRLPSRFQWYTPAEMGHSPKASVVGIAESSRAHRALVERVLEGSVLKNSPRLQELLRYLCECSIQDSGCAG